jgi:hypothetical protein
MTIRSDHDLLAVAGKLLERVQKLFLHAGLAVQKTDVVNDQNVDIAEPGSKTRQRLVSQCVCKLVTETLSRHKDNLHFRIQLSNFAVNRFGQMRLPDPDAAMNIERAESFAGMAGHLPSRCDGKFVTGSLNETVQLCKSTTFASGFAPLRLSTSW